MDTVSHIVPKAQYSGKPKSASDFINILITHLTET